MVSVMVACEQCGKRLKNAQGLRGHLQWAHKISSSRSGDAAVERATLATVAQLEELRAETIAGLEQGGDELRAACASLLSAVEKLGSAEQRQVLEGSDHGPGLCGSGQCAPCKASRKTYGLVVWKQAQQALTGEIVAACEWAGVTPAWRPVAEAVVAHRAHKHGVVEDVPSRTTMASLGGAEDPGLDALQSLAQGAPDPGLDALASLAQGAPDPEPDALTTIMAPDPERRSRWPEPR